MHLVSFSTTLPSLSWPEPMASWKVPYNQLMEENWPDLQMILHDMQAPLENGSCSMTAAFWDIPEGPW